MFDSNNLWALAAAKMSDADMRTINFSVPEKLQIISDLRDDAERSREVYMKKWRYRRRSGKTVIFTDLFGKAIRWVDMFKQIGASLYSMTQATRPFPGTARDSYYRYLLSKPEKAKAHFILDGAK